MYVKIICIWNKILKYKTSWIQEVHRMETLKKLKPHGLRNWGQPLKRLLDKWAWNVPRSGLTLWLLDGGGGNDNWIWQGKESGAYSKFDVICVLMPR